MTKKLLFLLVLLMTAATNTWAQDPVAKDIVVSPESGTNINDAIKDALGTNGDWALNITINLAKGGTYTVTESIVPSASITINGNGATIDASGLTKHFIMMSKTPSYDKVESGQYIVTTPSKIENVTIAGLTKSLFYDYGAPYLFEDFTFDNCLINYSKQMNVIINLAASTVINFTITNSTFYCPDKTSSSANCIAMSGKRPWQVTGFEDKEGKLLVDHNTFYNVAYKKQFFNTNTLKGQNKYKYEFNSNIFVNVSNKKIYGNMTSNKNQLTTDGKNTYLWDGTFFSETNYNGDAGLQTDPSFKDADNGDFTVGRSTEQYANKTGDTRWTTFKVMMKDGVMDADKWTISSPKAAEGTTVTATYSGTKKVIGVKAAKKAAASLVYPIALSAVTADYIGSVVTTDGNVYPAKTAVPDGCTAVGILGKVTETGHGLILALQNATDQTWNTINGWTSVTTYAGTTLKLLPDDTARGSLTSYTKLGDTTVSNWAVAQKSDYEAIFTNLGSTTGDEDGMTFDDNVNAYITGVGGTALETDSRAWSISTYNDTRAWQFTGTFWGYGKFDIERNVRPVLGFGEEATPGEAANTWTFQMPAFDVVLTPIYAPVAQWAKVENVDQLPTAIEGIYAGTTDAIVKAGTIAKIGETENVQGTLMYAVGTSATEQPAITAFSATLPTAEKIAAGDVYVWYYIKGADTPQGQTATAENTFNDSEICTTPLKVTVLNNKFNIQFTAANANTIEAGKATVTVGGTAATVTEGKLESVKMGSEVKVTAKEGYKFRKVEVKKGGGEPVLLTTITAADNSSFKSGSQTFGDVATVTLTGDYLKNDGSHGGWYCQGSNLTATISVAEANGANITSVKFYTAGGGSAEDKDAPFEVTTTSVTSSNITTYLNGNSIGSYGVSKIEVYGTK